MANGKDITCNTHNFLFLRIFKTFKIAIHPKALIIAFLAVLLFSVAIWSIDLIHSAVNDTNEPDKVLANISISAIATWSNIAGNIITLNFDAATRGVVGYFDDAKTWYNQHPVLLTILTVIKIIIFGIAGGAICRFAALQNAKGEKPGLFEAIGFSISKFFSLIFAPLLPVIMILILGIAAMLTGLLLNIPFAGEILTAIMMPLLIILGLLTAVIGAGALFGSPMLYPSIAYEGTDCFDAVSRAVGYFYSRPFKFIFYSIVALIYGAICFAFLNFLVNMALYSVHSFVDIGCFVNNSGDQVEKVRAIFQQSPYTDNNGAEKFAAGWIRLYIMAVSGLLYAFALSFYFSASTVIYSLMRKSVDDTEIEDVYIPETEDQPLTEVAVIDPVEEKAPENNEENAPEQ